MPEFVYSIGHSTHTTAKFLELLATHGITAVADVRSSPYSRYNPQFNRENLEQDLKKAAVAYVFLGRELGARPEDRTCYRDGKVQYERLAQTALFRQGLARIVRGSQDHRIALMCAEKDPLTCHRTILVCRHLVALGVQIRHILEDSRLETHEEAVRRLLTEVGLAGPDLFRTREDMIEDAYLLRGQEIAYPEEQSLSQDQDVRECP